MKYEANLTVNISRQGKRYVAYCPALDISTSGKTETEVRRRFDELVRLFVEEIEDAGTTAEVLTELGWKKEASKGVRAAEWLPPMFKSEQVPFRIPVAA